MSAHHSAPEMFSNGGDLEFIGVDHRLTLSFSEGDVLTIETEFALTRPGSAEILLDPDEDKKALDEAGGLVPRRARTTSRQPTFSRPPRRAVTRSASACALPPYRRPRNGRPAPSVCSSRAHRAPKR